MKLIENVFFIKSTENGFTAEINWKGFYYKNTSGIILAKKINWKWFLQ